MDKVSAVIITVNREMEVKRAISSVLNQTYSDIEVIVIIDGENPSLRESLGRSFSSRISVIETIDRVGGNAARNLGISSSTGKYIALLDDDDEWKETKIEKQVGLIKKLSDITDHVVFNSVYDLKEDGTMKIRPIINYRSSENIVEYLFKYRYGRSIGFVQTSTLFAKKEVFVKYPFDENLKKHQDWDWIVTVGRAGATFHHIPEPLTIYHNENTNNRVGRGVDYKNTSYWLEKINGTIEKRVYDRIIYTVLIPMIKIDPNLEEAARKKLVEKFRKEISMKSKISVTYLKFYISSRSVFLRKMMAYFKVKFGI